MKKHLLLIILFLGIYSCYAQNYNCLQPNVNHFFTNSNGYLRWISIDSTRAIGVDTVYYPYKTTRLSYMLLDTSDGSWLGSRVTKKTDGSFLFYTAWRDTVFINTQAAPGDSWTFYNDTSSRWYEATVISADTLTFMGITDSVKTIKITAYVGTTINATDPINSFEIVLSKYHGFVTTIDLYLFPYHDPTTATYTPSIDPYLFELTGFSGAINTASFIFSMVDYHVPTQLEIYDYNEGDVFMTDYDDSYHCATSYERMSYDSIISKTVISPFLTQYFIYKRTKTTVFPTGGPSIVSYSANTNTVYIDTSSITDMVNMPETNNSLREAYYYFKNDTSHCVNSTLFRHKNIITFEGCPYLREYKVGFESLATSSYGFGYGCAPGSTIGCDVEWTSRLVFSIKGGIPCGIRYDVTGIEETPTSGNFSVFPNPATSILNMSAPDKIASVVIFNMVGQIVLNDVYNNTNVQIDVATLPAGLYFAKINNSLVTKFLKN